MLPTLSINGTQLSGAIITIDMTHRAGGGGGVVVPPGGEGEGLRSYADQGKHDFCCQRQDWFESVSRPLLQSIGKTQLCAAAALVLRIRTKLGAAAYGIERTLRAIDSVDDATQRTIHCYVRQQRIEDIDSLRKCVWSAFYLHVEGLEELSNAISAEIDDILTQYKQMMSE